MKRHVPVPLDMNRLAGLRPPRRLAAGVEDLQELRRIVLLNLHEKLPLPLGEANLEARHRNNL